MFSSADFEKLYSMLNLDMVDTDCGIRCEKFCCVGNGDYDHAFKYLLPGEAEFLIGYDFHNHAVLEDFGFLIGFHSGFPNTCPCQSMRGNRPFCCRIFPFRPLIDKSECSVVDLFKTKNERFHPCWVEAPLQNWKKSAIDAWNFLLSDRTYLEFYAQYYLCIRYSENSSLSFSRAVAEDQSFREQILGLKLLEREELWNLCSLFFGYN